MRRLLFAATLASLFVLPACSTMSGAGGDDVLSSPPRDRIDLRDEFERQLREDTLPIDSLRGAPAPTAGEPSAPTGLPSAEPVETDPVRPPPATSSSAQDRSTHSGARPSPVPLERPSAVAVLDAATLEHDRRRWRLTERARAERAAARAEREAARAAGPAEVDDRTHAGDRGGGPVRSGPSVPGSGTDRGDAGLFRNRFEHRPGGGGGSGAEAGSDAARRDSVWEARARWTETALLRDSLALQHPYRRVYRHLTPGRPLEVRSMIWPDDASVVSRRPDRIRIATNWLDARRISDRELRCASEADGPRQLRLVADIRPIRGGAGMIVTGMQTHGLERCTLSGAGGDRVRAFRFDIWMGVNRASTLGTRFLLPRRSP